ncbi:hypothetical protein GUJ93_ZPchr0014g47543 [Zizania palustris]|uniref:Uncharacterized protein n=1 Tax=Zizania palustris TaxID=103762 RepID=A0A8J5TH71_ZIZPA|nr:hypothetical protein GUJ93_ZPchr0014g47543 [Zizania palustris]
MGNRSHGPCSVLPRLAIGAVVAVLLVVVVSLVATPVASHGDHEDHHHDDTGVHRNYLVIVRKPYQYDTNVYKNVSSWHASLLASVCDMAKEAMEEDPGSATRLIYSYRNVVNGFSARLTPEELAEMSKMDWFDKAFPEKTYQLLTTHTPQLLGLMDGRDMNPPPAKWNGRCDFNETVCNNKLIGARSFFESAKWKWKGLRDPVLPINEGQHGTHTSSTAAGAFVPGANIFGLGLGTAAGMAPRAHIAFYQVCYVEKGCDRDDILAAVDDAIEDGVDILSLSLGDEKADDFSDDPVSLGGYSAAMHGVLVSAAGGNTGPSPGTVVNEAPWVLTVGASTTDRRFLAIVKLGNGVRLDGESLSEPKKFGAKRPLVRDMGDGMCTSENALRSINVTGKIIICDPGGDLSTEKAKLVRRAGAAGMIIIAPQAFGLVIVPRPHVLPTVQVPFVVGQKIKTYIQTMKRPAATFVFKGTVLNTSPSPMVAPFSSRGPNRRSRGILKPDIIGPGVNILAGVPEVEGVEFARNAVMPMFDIKSGTSMAAPHISGVAALIKKAHPTWSPAAIKSAMMTTANTVDNLQKPMADADGKPATYFAMGAGNVNPQKAMDPGLVYNLTAADYVPYLCGLGYTDQKVNSIIHPAPPVECTKLPNLDQKDLNYPSITATVDQTPFAMDITRSVTNVGVASSTYAVEVDVPASVTVEVKPPTLTFNALDEVLNYTITVKSASGQPSLGVSTIEGQLKWVSGNYVVRSPILIFPGAGAGAGAESTQPTPQT